ncbi:MAG: hypothetical protein CMC18_08610 [Flavobacteriaceae bacterium]|nr:hypothetical protein [Flavobacteriaceae bacterium]
MKKGTISVYLCIALFVGIFAAHSFEHGFSVDSECLVCQFFSSQTKGVYPSNELFLVISPEEDVLVLDLNGLYQFSYHTSLQFLNLTDRGPPIKV